MRLVTAAAAALFATAALAQTPAPIATPYDPDFIVADDRPVVLNPRVKEGETALSWSVRYRRTGRLAHDVTFSTLGFGKRTLPAGTPLYFRHFSESPMLGIEFSVWCAPELKTKKGRPLASCILLRDGPIAMKSAQLVDAKDENPWRISSLRIDRGGTAPRPEIWEQDVGFPTVVTQRIDIGRREDGRQFIELIDEAKCDGCPSSKVTRVRATPVEEDGSATFDFGEGGWLTVRPADGDAYDVSLGGPLASMLSAP